MRLRRVFAWSGLGLGVLLLAVAGVIGWFLFTTAGARWVAATVTARFAPQVKYATLDGTIAGQLEITDFEFAGAPDAARVHIARLRVDPTLSMLLSRVLRIERAQVEGLTLVLPPPKADKPDEPDKPLWVEPPLDVVVEDFALVNGVVLKGERRLAQVKRLGISARWSREALVIERLNLLPGDIEGDFRIAGRITPQGETVRAVLHAQWQGVVLPESLAGFELASQGQVDFDGTPQSYEVGGKFDVGPRGEPATHVVLQAAGTDRSATLHNLILQQSAGRLALQGLVEFSPKVTWNLRAQASDFDPGALLAGWHGQLDLDFATEGRLEEAGPAGNLVVHTLSGELRGRPLAGGGAIDFAAPAELTGDLKLASGRSRVAVTGRPTGGQRVDARVVLAIASLGDWLPETSGSLNGDFRVRGAWPKLAIQGNAQGRALSAAGVKMARLAVDASVASPLDPEGRVSADARDVAAAGLQFARVEVKAAGNQARHRAAVTADGERFDGDVAVEGGLVEGGWRGELKDLGLRAPDIDLRLQSPAAASFVNGDFAIERACLADGESVLCAAADLKAGGALEASYSFENLQLALANALAPEAMPGQLRGELAGEGQVRRAPDGQWFGDARITSPVARLVMLDEEPGTSALGQRTLLLYENLDLNAALEGENARATLTAGLQNDGRLSAKLTLNKLTTAAPTLGGSVEAHMPTLAPFAGFVPTVGNLDGVVDATIQLGGTLQAPEITGDVNATRLQADLGKLGIELRDGRLEGHARTDGGFTLAGSVASGKGHIELAGTMSARGVIDARVEGQNFLAADIPGANVVVTPDLKLTGDPKGYLLSGEVTIPRADINLQKLPQDQPPGVSPDVVVIRNGKEVSRTEEASALPLRAVVLVKLGEAIKVAGYGLDSTLAGQLEVREEPGVPTTGSGQLTVAGTYKAYGQDLTIEDGRLLFAGTPLDNPRLSIVAMREINDRLSTGLRIAGSAKRPVITVVSQPNVGEADALSYLVTGRSLSDVGSASGGSQDALASAARSLEGAAGGLVAKRIGARLGLDEAGVEENEMIGGSALTIGEYLSPRLYLSYGVGLFEPGEVIALRYKLSDDVGVRVQRGSEETRAGVEYRIEK